MWYDSDSDFLMMMISFSDSDDEVVRVSWVRNIINIPPLEGAPDHVDVGSCSS